MKSIKKIIYSILFISFFYIVFIKNFVYADVIYGLKEITYTPLYYIAIIVMTSIVVGISILILRKVCKNNQLEKDTEDERGVEKNDKCKSKRLY